MPTILSDRAKNKKSKELNKTFTVHLQHKYSTVPKEDINLLISSAEAYQKERDTSTCYRISANINIYASNVLFDVTGERSYETITTLREYDVTDMVFAFTEEEILKRENGWYHYLTGSTLSQCEKVFLEPEPQKFSILDLTGNTNYDVYITYPGESTQETMFSGVPLSEGLRVYSLDTITYNNRNVLKVFTSVPHNLTANQTIEIFNSTTTNLVGEHEVYKIGDEIGDYTDTCFLIDTDAAPPDPTIENISLKKKVDGVLSSYHLRYFKKLLSPSDAKTIPASFGQTLFEDRSFNTVCEKDIDIDGLTTVLNDNDRPVSELYVTIVKKPVLSPSGDNYWSSVSSGIETAFAFSDYDINTLTINNLTNAIEADVNNNQDYFFGDIVEKNVIEQSETVLIQAMHRFNSINRDDNGHFEGYYYKPHHLLQIKQYSDSISETFDVTEAASYADNFAGKYIWREQKTNSDVDNPDIPFINGCHYIFKKINLMVRRQDPCADFALGIYTITGDCISFEDLVIKTDETC